MDRQVIRGWRGRMDDETEAALRDLHTAPFTVEYIEGMEAPRADSLLGHKRWFRKIYDQERTEASARLAALRVLRARVRWQELNEEQRAERRAHENKLERERRSRQSPEWHKAQSAARLARMHRNMDAARATERRTRAKNRDATNARRRARRAANLEEYHAKEQAKRATYRERRRLTALAPRNV